MATFALVHGGFHGAWCWERLIPFLVERGIDAVAMDLPSDDPDATLSDYVIAVVDASGGHRGTDRARGALHGGHGGPVRSEGAAGVTRRAGVPDGPSAG